MNHFDDELKNEAIRRFLAGESAGKIAKDMGIPSPDYVRKWVQDWRKKRGISAKNYRKKEVVEEVDEIMKLRNIINEIEEQRDIALKALSIFAKGEISGLDELKMFIKNLFDQRFGRAS